jgi:hypothetical protein
MEQLTNFGDVPWSPSDLVAALEEFSRLYETRPIRDNTGGMKAPHMFSAWFGLKRLKPKAVIESGIWHGQGTWLIEQACPDAELFCIDINLEPLRYRSQRARYFTRDFSTLEWNTLPKEETVLFFDDHQNAYERLKTVRWFGFRHAFFEDNYPPTHGDCYSLKKVWMHAGFRPPAPNLTPVDRAKGQVRRLLGVSEPPQVEIAPNSIDATYLRANLEAYYEFPPIFRRDKTRWGDPWADEKYPTPPALLTRVEAPYQQVFLDEALDYTWICYARLKREAT